MKSIWRAARLSEVIQAILARATTVEVVSAEEAIPHVPRPGMGVDIEVDLHVDCIAATPFLTTRALIDENGVVVHSMWIDGISGCVRAGTLSALHRARVPPVYANGLPGAAWIDLRIALPAQRQGVSCGGSRPMRPPAAIVALDGHRIVITAPRSSVSAALPAQFEIAQGTERMAALLEELDRYSAPRLGEYRDDEPCDPPLRDLRWVPGDVLGMQSILDRALCVSYDDESECARSEGGSRVPKAEPDKR
ncbi:MAG: hypothetical protein LC732_05020, partial [Acidobacteria bacterium]|nr:hypothetical protein [Acidobacteriota bacterium]